MKKAILILATGICCASTINAQDGKSVRFGIKVAPNIGWIKPSDKALNGSGTEVGFNFGLMGDFRIGGNDNYAFCTGLFYMTKVGGSYEQTLDVLGTKFTTTTTAKLAYVELPITLKLKTNEIGYMTYFGQIGIDNGINVGAKYDAETTPTPSTGNLTDEDFSDYVATYRAGLVVGAGAEYNFSGNTSMMISLTYNNGLTNMFANKVTLNGVDVDLPKAKLHYFELGLGVFF